MPVCAGGAGRTAMMRMTYEDAIAFIHGTYGLGEKNGLENMHPLLALLGNPQEQFKSVHVAGTNGKGSVCAFLQASLRVAGYRTGLYTSPFLQRYNERMRIDGRPIPDEGLALLMEPVADAVEQLRGQGIRPTEFEIGTALAFLFFAREKVDIAVIEVGLGGRLDPTNVIHPLVSVIAAIGLDHTKVLGSTLEAIAGEKAGIIKQGVPVVLSAQNKASVRRVVEDRCLELGAPLLIPDAGAKAELGIPGVHQQYNAAAASAALQLLREGGFDRLSEAAIAEGLRRARWPGRLEWVQDEPAVLLDGAHNGQGVQALAGYVRSLPPAHTVLVCGILQDKQWQDMVSTFATVAEAVVCVMPENHRALTAQVLADAFVQEGVAATTAATVPEAIDRAKELAGAKGRVVVAGSLYLVGEVREWMLGTEDLLLAEEE